MDYLNLEEKHIAPTYNRLPLTIVEGDGVKVKDDKGKKYLDFVAGLAVNGLGHSHPEIAKTLKDQAEKLVHTSNLYHLEEQIELGKKLAEITPGNIQKFFFCNSGTEAVEAALKLSIKHTDRDKFVAIDKSFHGRTSGSLGVTWKSAYKKPFKELIFSNCVFSPPDDLEKAKENIDEETAAFIAEPIQGEGGVTVLSDDFLTGVKDICEDNDALMIMDEIQAGICRTGKWFASEHSGVEPDIITMAKALGNGFPIGCMGARPEVMNSFTPGDHASTFGGNPLGCKVGKKVIEIMEEKNLPQKVEEKGKYFKEKLRDLANNYDMVEEVRGKGLMLGMLMDDEEKAEKIVEEAREDGFLINCTSKRVLRFIPPLIVQKKHIDKLIDELEKIMEVL